MDDSPFEEAINQPVIDIPRAALAFARSLAFPSLNVDRYIARLDALGELARQVVPEQSPLADRVDALSDFLFYQMEFRGNRENYNDPQNSYLNRVLDRKLGIPITLSIIYTTIARHLGLPAYGISLPGHFIVGIFENGSEILVDPFNAGLRISPADCSKLVREATGYNGPFQQKWLQPVRPPDLIARMLTNLCNAYIQQENWQMAITVIQMLLKVQPHSDFHLRDLGYVHLYNGSLRLSAQYLEEYLRRSPGAADFENVRSSLEIVAGRLALWN